MEHDWQTYHQQTRDRSVSPLLQEAMKYVDKKRVALDLGAGALVESKFLLSQGFEEVVAVDIVPFASIVDSRFTFIESTFQAYSFPSEKFDIVNAQFALPFAEPDTFDDIWSRMQASLAVGGIFSGQLFGYRDAWSTIPTMTFHTKKEVEGLLNGMNVIKFEEIERDAPLAAGEIKHWHIFAIIVQKK